jgi:hypothetical protein
MAAAFHTPWNRNRRRQTVLDMRSANGDFLGHHKGNRDGADDFRVCGRLCAASYMTASVLAVMGDVEEL